MQTGPGALPSPGMNLSLAASELMDAPGGFGHFAEQVCSQDRHPRGSGTKEGRRSPEHTGRQEHLPAGFQCQLLLELE